MKDLLYAATAKALEACEQPPTGGEAQAGAGGALSKTDGLTSP
jgi:hypothetical protein